MNERGRLPDFFIVGAPKCGTTALHTYLGRHPGIFMPEVKEPHYFGSDLVSRKFIRHEEDYRSLYASAPRDSLIGEASVYYLYSKVAAAEIGRSCPSARIIIMLRDPVDMVHALHSQAVTSGNEEIVDFAEALEAEEDRRRGRRIPEIADFPMGLLYRDVGRYSKQIERFLEVFNRDRVHVIVFDDFADDPEKVYRDTLSFLAVEDANFDNSFEKVNENLRLRSVGFEHFLKRRWSLRANFKGLFPSLYSSLYALFHSLNHVKSSRARMDPELREGLRSEFEAEIAATSRLIGRDLSHWTRA